MIQLHEAQSLLLILALLILSYLVFRLLRPGASNSDHRDDRHDATASPSRHSHAGSRR